ncbi:hypothetical protein Y032_0070g459 [Ancylostoma ceylanicum]|nr:hypothetical protein Y032_0070g459 [Ancylostoma ceylanicum]
MAVIDSRAKESDVQDSVSKKMQTLLGETGSSRARRNRHADQVEAAPPDSDGESLPSLDKVRFDDNPVQIRDSQKERKKREKANVKRTERKQRREEQKPTPVPSSTSTDSLPSLNK